MEASNPQLTCGEGEINNDERTLGCVERLVDLVERFLDLYEVNS